MPFSISQARVPDLKRAHNSPAYGFLEEIIEAGTGFGIEGGGHFIVAPDNCILSRFVVDLRLPANVPTKEGYLKIAAEMINRSRGMMFFDSQGSDGYALAWMLQLPVLPGSPLFEYAPDQRSFAGAAEHARLAEAADADRAAHLIAAVPAHFGGRSAQAVRDLVTKNAVWVLEEAGKPVGAAVVVPQGNTYAWLETFVLDENLRRKGLGHKLFEALGVSLHRSGRRIVFGMSHQGGNEYSGVKALGSRIVRQGYHAFLGGIMPDFEFKPSYSS